VPIMCCTLIRRRWVTRSIVALGVILLHDLGIVVCRSIVVGRGAGCVYSGLICFLQAALSTTNIGSLTLLSLFFRLAGLRRYVGGDHERLTIQNSVTSSDLVAEVVGHDDDACDLKFATVQGLRGARNLATLSGSWRSRSIKLLQHTALAGRVPVCFSFLWMRRGSSRRPLRAAQDRACEVVKVDLDWI
jgi:hypothetical protein